MELVQIRYFVETAHQMHFASAAQDLGITQPALSSGIHTLEKELGYKLFDCSNKRKIFLTPAGEAFLEDAEKLLNDLRNAKRRAKDAAQGKAGHLTIGALSSVLGRTEVLDTLVEMQKLYPDVTLEIIEDTSAGLSARIKEHTLDLVFTRFEQDVFNNDELLCKQIYLDELFVVFRNDHPLANKKNLSIDDLKDERIIMVPERTSSAMRTYVRQLCVTKGNFTPKVSDESSSSYTALRLVEAGMGITFVSTSYRGMFSEHLVYRKFDAMQMGIPIFAVTSKDRKSPIRDTFLALLRKKL